MATLILVMATTLSTAANTNTGKGWVDYQGQKFSPRSSIGVWNEAGNRISVYLPTFVLSQAQIDNFARYPSDESLAELASGRPFIVVNIEFARGVKSARFRPKDVFFYSVTLFNSPNGGGYSSQKGAVIGKLSVQGDYRARKPIKMVADSQGDQHEAGMQWKLEARCKLLRKVSFEELKKRSQQE